MYEEFKNKHKLVIESFLLESRTQACCGLRKHYNSSSTLWKQEKKTIEGKTKKHENICR